MLKITMSRSLRPSFPPAVTPPVQDKQQLFALVRRNDVRQLEEFLGGHPGAAAWRENGHTPLEIAVKNNSLPCMQALLHHGADANALSDDGLTSPLLIAAAGNNTQTLITLLHRGAKLHIAVNGETSPVMAAVEAHALSTLQVLLAHGAPCRTLDGEGQTALHIATQKGHLDAAKLLLEHGAPIDQRNAESLTPLMLAAQQRNLAAARFLFEQGADETLRSDLRETPLDIARAFANDDRAFLFGFEALVFERYKRAAAGIEPGMHAGTQRQIKPQKPIRFKPRGR